MGQEFIKKIESKGTYNVPPQNSIVDLFSNIGAWSAGGTVTPTISSVTSRTYSAPNAMKIIVGNGLAINPSYVSRFAPFIYEKFINFEINIGFEMDVDMQTLGIIFGNFSAATQAYWLQITNANTFTPNIDVFNGGVGFVNMVTDLLLGGASPLKPWLTIKAKANTITKKWVSLSINGVSYNVSALNASTTLTTIEAANNMGQIEIRPAGGGAGDSTIYLDRLVLYGSSV